MKIIIVGCGKVGSHLAKLLSIEDHEITVIDINRQSVEEAVNEYDVIGINGNGASFSVQEEAGISRCDMFIAVTGNDELNIMSCMVADRLGAKRTVSRVRNTDYSGQLLFMQNRLGIDLVINPEFETAMELSRVIEFPAATKLETFAKGRVELAEVIVTEDSPLNGLMLKNLRKELEVAMLVCAIQRHDEVIIPSGDFVIKAGDKVHFTAARLQLANIFKAIGIRKKKIKTVFIVGGSRTAYYLSQYLLKTNKKVKLVERDRQHAAILESSLDGASVICGDGTDPDLLFEEGIQNFDASVALTQIDEENIILSMYAAKLGVGKTACKINRDPLAGMVNSTLPGCSVVCPKTTTAGIILRYIRAVDNADGSSVRTLYKILDNKAEALELIAAEDCPLIGHSLKELNLKKNIIIACVSRHKDVIIPDGNTVIKEGDSVIVITSGTPLSDLSEVLE